MQRASSRTWVTESISYDDNRYAEYVTPQNIVQLFHVTTIYF